MQAKKTNPAHEQENARVARVLRQLASSAIDLVLLPFHPGTVHAVVLVYTKEGAVRGVCGSDPNREQAARMVAAVAKELSDPSRDLATHPGDGL